MEETQTQTQPDLKASLTVLGDLLTEATILLLENKPVKAYNRLMTAREMLVKKVEEIA